MDFWVVAAAAGAGYLAKYWNRVSKDVDGSCRLLSEDSYLESPESRSCPFTFPKQARRRDKSGKDVSLDGKALDANSSEGLFTVEVESNIRLDGDKVSWIRNYDENNLFSILNLPLSFSPNGSNFMDTEDENEQNPGIVGNRGFLFPCCSDEVVRIHCSSGNKTSLRSKHLSGYISRPLNSLESCFMAQLYKEHIKMEEYVFGSLSSPSIATRPFLVSDGSRIISRANDNSVSPLSVSKEYKLHKEACRVKDGSVFEVPFEVPSLPEVGSSNDAMVMKFNEDTGRSRRLSSSNNMFREKHIRTQCDATFIFSLGISFGMLTSIMENKREIDELRELLKQTGNLIQDLHEELDMKDSMTVKELHNENYGSQGTCDHSVYEKELNVFSPEKHMDNSPTFDREESYDQREGQSLESMSKIEAELEAELERLGLDMNASSLERKFSELVELDPEFVMNFAQGELRADLAGGNYVVSPHELSLQLHEVVQSQLEERVKELEIALENSQRRVQLLELERKGSSFQNAGAPNSSFAGGNTLTYEDSNPTVAQPLILNLSGEALDAYSEAYEELIKINNGSKENSPSGIHDDERKEGSTSHDQYALEVQHGDANGSITMLQGKCSRVCDLNVTVDGSCSNDNEMERQLIRQIVERTKKGSPVYQNAERILYSMDEDEH